MLKIKVTILDSSYGDDKNDCNFITIMALKFNEEPLTTTSKSRRFVEEDEDNKDEIMNIYNDLLKEHIKLKKLRRKGFKEL